MSWRRWDQGFIVALLHCGPGAEELGNLSLKRTMRRRQSSWQSTELSLKLLNPPLFCSHNQKNPTNGLNSSSFFQRCPTYLKQRKNEITPAKLQRGNSSVKVHEVTATDDFWQFDFFFFFPCGAAGSCQQSWKSLGKCPWGTGTHGHGSSPELGSSLPRLIPAREREIYAH